MNPSASRSTAALIGVFLASVCVPFALLVERFGYDDVLREPPGTVLRLFHEGGPALVAIWLAFALGCLLFVPVALRLDRVLPGGAGRAPGWVAMLGVASALLQAVGLLRWVFVVPAIASAWSEPSASQATRDAAELAFAVVHQYGGVVIGEFLGQVTLVAWTVGVARPMLGVPGVWRVLGVAALAIAATWIVGFGELLATVMPDLPYVEAAPIAFTAWEAWLLCVAIALAVRAGAERPLARHTTRPTGAAARLGAPLTPS